MQEALKYLNNTEDAARAYAFGALCRMDSLEIDHLTAALTDPSPLVRRRALLAIPDRWGGDFDAEIDLPSRLRDTDASILEVACYVAGECDPTTEAILDRLEDIAQHHDEDLCRESAVAALGSLGQQRSAPIVVRACSDRPTIRRRAVLALVAFDGPEVDKMLRELTKDTDWQVRQAAEELLSIE